RRARAEFRLRTHLHQRIPQVADRHAAVHTDKHARIEEETMKTSTRITLAALATLILLDPCSALWADEPKNSQPQEREATAKAPSVPVYKPPLRGAPGGRVGGGTRGASGRDIFVLSVLAPDHTGLTIQEQPSLFWFISNDTSLPVELTIVDPKT